MNARSFLSLAVSIFLVLYTNCSAAYSQDIYLTGEALEKFYKQQTGQMVLGEQQNTQSQYEQMIVDKSEKQMEKATQKEAHLHYKSYIEKQLKTDVKLFNLYQSVALQNIEIPQSVIKPKQRLALPISEEQDKKDVAYTPKDTPKNVLNFAISAEYPPFEYKDHLGQLHGFDIDLGEMIAKELGMRAEFHDMRFSTILPSLNSGMTDAAISSITINKDREKMFDFSDPYYEESMSVLFLKTSPITSLDKMDSKKIAAQLGSTMEIWLRDNCKKCASIIAMDTNPQAVEALKTERLDGVLLDSVQASTFVKKSTNFAYAYIAQSGLGYGVTFKKGSPMKEKVNTALRALEKRGEIEKLKKKYTLQNKE